MKKQYDFSHGRRGAVLRVPSGKTRITIRIDDDILQWFRGQVEAGLTRDDLDCNRTVPRGSNHVPNCSRRILREAYEAGDAGGAHRDVDRYSDGSGDAGDSALGDVRAGRGRRVSAGISLRAEQQSQ